MTPQASNRVAVVGAGIAGIASSIRLAVQGWHVDVYEANSYLGGKLTAFERDGFRFDAGPSMFTMPHLVEELFRLAGRNPQEYFQHTPLKEACRYWYDDGTRLTAWTDPVAFGEEVQRVLGVPRALVEEHLQRAAKKFNLSKGIFLERSLHKASTYFSSDVLTALANIRSLDLTATMDKSNRRSLKHPKLVQLFNRYATYNGSSPYRAPGVLNLIPHLEHGLGASLPKGGMHEITKSLVALAESLGVRFHAQCPVEEIVVQDGRVKGVRVFDNDYPADLVVCNSDIVPAYRKLLANQKAPEKVLRRERSSSAMIFYWGMDGAFPDLGLHNIFFAADYESEFQALFSKGGIHPDPTIYINITSKFCPVDAPSGKENWFVMVNAPADSGQDWAGIRRETRAAVLRKLSRLLGVDVAAKIICEDHLDPPSIASRTSSHGGALYGTSSNGKLSAFLRHANFSSRIRGLYFCGGSVHPGGGIPLCLLSAKIVSEIVGKAS